MTELSELVRDVVPYVSATAAAYGGAALQRTADAVEDAAVDATVGLGKRLLRRLLASNRSAQVQAAVAEVAQEPTDEAATGVLRAQLLKAVTDDPGLADDLRHILRNAGVLGDEHRTTISHSQGIQVGTGNVQHNNHLPRPRPFRK